MMKNFQLHDTQEVLANSNLESFICSDLRSSLSSIGFSSEFLDDLINNLGNLNVQQLGETWKDELNQKYSLGFFQNLVPTYFSEYVVPVTPASNKIIDVGCGTGILAKLYSQDGRFNQVIGIDINSYPEWHTFQNEKIKFKVVKEDEFNNFLITEKPDTVVLTWTLHHMQYDEQERYISYIHQNLKQGARLIVLEDSYSTTLQPENGVNRYKEFMKWSEGERKNIMSVYDWVANRVLAQREKVPIPCAYRTLEEWSEFLEQKGFKILTQKFIGFPEHRDINTPQSLIVCEKI